MPDNLRSRMIRAAYTHHALRPRLIPLITKAATTSDVAWAADEIEKALGNLGDVVQMLETRGSGSDPEANTSLADDHSEVAAAVQEVRKFSQSMTRHLAQLKRVRG